MEGLTDSVTNEQAGCHVFVAEMMLICLRYCGMRGQKRTSKYVYSDALQSPYVWTVWSGERGEHGSKILCSCECGTLLACEGD